MCYIKFELFVNFVLKSKTKKEKSTKMLQPLITPPFTYMYCSAMPRAKQSSTKDQLYKKTEMLCWSIFLLVYDWIYIKDQLQIGEAQNCR